MYLGLSVCYPHVKFVRWSVVPLSREAKSISCLWLGLDAEMLGP